MFVLVEGSVCGLKEVDLGKDNYIVGSVIADELKVGEKLIVKGNIFARTIMLKAGAKVEGHVLCEKILDSTGSPANVLPKIKINGTLSCSQNLEIATECEIGGIITSRDLHVRAPCRVNFIKTRGGVYLSDNTSIPHVECARLTTGKDVKVGLACVEEYAELGERTAIGFLYCEKGITGIDHEVRLWNSTLISRQKHPSVQNLFYLDQKEFRPQHALGITLSGEVVTSPETSLGVLYTTLIDKNLLQMIGSLTQMKLSV